MGADTHRPLAPSSHRETLRLIRRLLALAFLIPLAFVWPLFLGERFYAHTPILSGMPELPPWMDVLFFCGMLILLVRLLIVRSAERSLVAFLLLTFAFSLWDQSRWMPFFYQFWVMLAVLASAPEGENATDEERQRALNTLSCIPLGIWLWSGIHKINAAYFGIGHAWLVRPLLRFFPDDLHNVILGSAFLAPIVEGGGALLLIVPATRKLGVLVLTAMHLFILLALGPLGRNWNQSVWSWNVLMLIFLWLLYFPRKMSGSELIFGTAQTLRGKLLHGAVVILFLVMPGFNFARTGLWDDFPSFCLYSWTTKEAEIVVPENSERLLPPEMTRSLHRDGDTSILSLLDWSYDVFSLPPYHASRVFFSVFGKTCEYTHGDEGLTFRIFEKPAIMTGHMERLSYKCAPENGPRAIREVERLP